MYLEDYSLYLHVELNVKNMAGEMTFYYLEMLSPDAMLFATRWIQHMYCLCHVQSCSRALNVTKYIL